MVAKGKPNGCSSHCPGSLILLLASAPPKNKRAPIGIMSQTRNKTNFTWLSIYFAYGLPPRKADFGPTAPTLNPELHALSRHKQSPKLKGARAIGLSLSRSKRVASIAHVTLVPVSFSFFVGPKGASAHLRPFPPRPLKTWVRFARISCNLRPQAFKSRFLFPFVKNPKQVASKR